MATSYSDNLAIALQGTGDNPGTWGTITNGNLGTVVEQAIVGKATITFPSDADYSISMVNGPATSPARCLYLNVTSTGSLSAIRTLTVPNIQKTYIIKNATSPSVNGYAITIASAGGGSTVNVPNGGTMLLYVNGVTGVSQQFSEIASGTTIGGAAIADLTSTQTFTNKTFTSPSITNATLTTPIIPVILGATYRTSSISSIATSYPSTPTTVTITDSGVNSAAVGDYVIISGVTTSIGGIPAASFNKTLVITSIVSTTAFTVTVDTSATSAATGGSGATMVYYYASSLPSASATLTGTNNTATLTNKRVTPRVTDNGTTYAGNLTPPGDSSDQYSVTVLTGAITITNPSGAPANGQKLIIRITDSSSRSPVGGTNIMSCTSGLTTVTVGNNAYSAVAGDYVTISGATTFGGISAANLNGRFQIVSAIAGTSFTISVASAATSTVSSSGGSITLNYDGFKISWGGLYRAVGTVLPSATTASKTIYVGCIYNTTGPYWDVVAVSTQA
jgi:hypothetical protein